MTSTSYFIRLGDALSQFFNVAILNGHPNESISGRAYRENWTTLEITLDTFLGDNHCKEAYENDLAYSKAIVSRIC